MTDQEIVDRIREGSENAVNHLYEKYYKMGTNVITKNNGSDDEASDVYQEAVFIIWRKIIAEDFVLSSKLSTFFYGICYKLWLKELSRKRRYDCENENVEEVIDDFVFPLENEEIKDILKENLDALIPSDRDILCYFYIENKTMEEITSILGYVNPDSAKAKKYKAKLALTEIIKSKYKHSDFLD